MNKNVLKNLLLVGVLMLAACNPFKVTDPNDPNFDPYQFKFDPYYFQFADHFSCYDALKKSLPVGLPMDEVDKILVDSAGAKKQRIKTALGNDYYAYIYKRWYHPLIGITPDIADGIRIAIYYDDNETLIKFRIK